mmetsp:Transcript_70535/g.151121  ORF Transcript_70535/g.151121 Transcript_70535/m.151121 type:complete len:216 (-) Transcript_70535:1563-2210(-)
MARRCAAPAKTSIHTTWHNQSTHGASARAPKAMVLPCSSSTPKASRLIPTAKHKYTTAGACRRRRPNTMSGSAVNACRTCTPLRSQRQRLQAGHRPLPKVSGMKTRTASNTASNKANSLRRRQMSVQRCAITWRSTSQRFVPEGAKAKSHGTGVRKKLLVEHIGPGLGGLELESVGLGGLDSGLELQPVGHGVCIPGDASEVTAGGVASLRRQRA